MPLQICQSVAYTHSDYHRYQHKQHLHCLGELHQRSVLASSQQPACLVLEDPVHILSAVGLRNDCHQLVLPKASIDKGIDKGGCKVLASRVYSWSRGRSPLCQMRLVHLQVWEVAARQAG